VNRADQRGYAMAALLVGLAVMGILLSAAMPVWRTMVKREKEEELVFRGQQYARAIGLFQRKYANAYPPSLDVLVEQKFLRKKYTDPMVKGDDGGEGAFQLLYQSSLPQRPGQAPGGGGLAGAIGTRGGQAPGGITAPAGGGRSGLGSGQPGTGLGQTGLGSRPAGPVGGIVGVTSKSKEQSLRLYNGRTAYNQWEFVWSPAMGGAQTAPRPGMQPGQGPGVGGRGVSPPSRSPGTFDPRR
jgi:type II secretory pathway pseudopilin PulG